MENYEVKDQFEIIDEIKNDDYSKYNNSTSTIVSKVSYLIGVPRKVFENEHSTQSIEIFDNLENDKNARIIRNLCLLRTIIERNFKTLNDKMRYEYKSLESITEIIYPEIFKQLYEDGITFSKNPTTKLISHIIDINRYISDRINNCKSLFPLWLNWDYLKNIFIMQNGLAADGVKAAADQYYNYLNYYPYKMYINWRPVDCGNILYNDKKFVTLLYSWNHSTFLDYSKVSDISDDVKGGIYDFIDQSSQLIIIVDCENADPYKLCAALRNLDEVYLKKIQSVILVDDPHTSSVWRIMEQFTSIKVEHMMNERVKENKSLVDIKLAARVCMEHYQNKVDSFIIVSSDSDYWGLITSLPLAKFLTMIEREICSKDLKIALENAGIFYCYIDDFYSGNIEEIKHIALFSEMHNYIVENVKLNVNKMLEYALINTRVDMTASEKMQFFNKYVKTIEMSINSNGDVIISFKKI